MELEEMIALGLSERYAKILDMRYNKGATYREIAKAFGFGNQVARTLVKKAKGQVILAREQGAFVGLPEQTKNLLNPSRDDLQNYGPKTHEQVCEWANKR